jgi:hypothetical protein
MLNDVAVPIWVVPPAVRVYDETPEADMIETIHPVVGAAGSVKVPLAPVPVTNATVPPDVAETVPVHDADCVNVWIPKTTPLLNVFVVPVHVLAPASAP